MIYGMATKSGDIVGKTTADNLEEAINYFTKIKQLPKEDLLKLFILTEIK